MINEKLIRTLCEEFLSGSGKFLVEVAVKPGNRIMVFMDGEQGVTIDDCQSLSRHIEQNLDRNTEDYDLLVSSSGADKPFSDIRQYRKNLGKLLEFLMKDGSKFEGFLESADENILLIRQQIKPNKKQTETVSKEVKYNEIKQAKVVISFKH
jgi:ribosome maturation factor RimP